MGSRLNIQHSADESRQQRFENTQLRLIRKGEERSELTIDNL